MNIIILDQKDVNKFWDLRICLLRELGEISTKTNLTNLEKSTKEYFLSNNNYLKVSGLHFCNFLFINTKSISFVLSK